MTMVLSITDYRILYFVFLTDSARVVRVVENEHDDVTLSRHRRELPEVLDEEDKPKARSKVRSFIETGIHTIGIHWRFDKTRIGESVLVILF